MKKITALLAIIAMSLHAKAASITINNMTPLAFSNFYFTVAGCAGTPASFFPTGSSYTIAPFATGVSFANPELLHSAVYGTASGLSLTGPGCEIISIGCAPPSSCGGFSVGAGTTSTTMCGRTITYTRDASFNVTINII